MRFTSGIADQVLYFVAVDSTDLSTRETGLTSFIVYRARNSATAVAMTTPTVTEVDAVNMPGVYALLLDEDMTIASGNDTEDMLFHITQAAMAPVTIAIELYRPKITTGQTLAVSGGVGNAQVKGMDAATLTASALALDAAEEMADAVWDEAVAGHNDAGSFGASLQLILVDTAELQTNQGGWLTATGFATAASLALVDTTVDAILVDTSTTLPASIVALNDLSAADVAAELLAYDAPTRSEMDAAFTVIKGSSWSATDTLEAIRDRGDAAWATSTLAATDIVSAGAITTLSGSVVLVDLCTANTDMRGTNAAATAAALATAQNDLDIITGATGAVIDAATRTAIADALLDRASGVETSRTVRGALRLILAATAGKLSGADTSTILIRDTNDTKDRISATVDADGNRLAVTLDDA